jgi:hypothetical protein
VCNSGSGKDERISVEKFGLRNLQDHAFGGLFRVRIHYLMRKSGLSTVWIASMEAVMS